MEPKFKAGETVYYVNSNNFIEEAAVVMTIADFVTIRFKNREWGTRVRGSHLYRSREEAEESIKE